MTKLTQQQFLDKANRKHGIGTYDYSLVDYKRSNYKIDIICKQHGLFSQKATSHADDGAGCPMCAKELYIKNHTLTTEEFIVRCQKVHGDRYEYSKVIYTGRLNKVIICCKDHGEFLQKASAHSQGAGCPKCARSELANSRRLTKNEWIKRCREVHGNAYEYHTDTIKGRLDDMIITCKIHGEFTQSLGNHLTGSGCKGCSKSGYDTSKAGVLYVLQFDEITKVGITNRKVSARIRNLKTESGKKFKEVFSVDLDGLTALNIEKQLLKELSETYNPVIENFSGYTECFYNVDVIKLINRIEELRKSNGKPRP